MSNSDIQGSGGKAGGGQTFREDENSLRSNVVVSTIEAISEGPIIGPVAGLKSIYLDNVPLMNADNSYNFGGKVSTTFRYGLPVQDEVPGFELTSSPVSVNTQVTAATPVVRSIIDADVSSIGLTISLPNGLYNQDTNTNSLTGTKVELAVDVKPATSGVWTQQRLITYDDKTTSPYQETFRITRPGTGAWDVRLRRLTADTSSSTLRNNTWWSYYTELRDLDITYPNVAYVGIQVDAASVNSNQIPTRSVEAYGIICSVPTNMDAATRTFTGTWDGTFKQSWTDDPAWVLYDLCTNERYGMGRFGITEDQVDKYSFYAASVYNSELVSYTDKNGDTTEGPRYSFNYQINEGQLAPELLNRVASVMKAKVMWVGGQITVLQDRPEEYEHIFNNTNVIDGFTYKGTALQQRHTVCNVLWNDPLSAYQQRVTSVEDADGIAAYGYNPIDIAAYGCTNEPQAIRFGRDYLFTVLKQTDTVSFTTGLEGQLVLPHSVIQIWDDAKAPPSSGYAGRLEAGSTTTVINLDREVTAAAGARLDILTPDGTLYPDVEVADFGGGGTTWTESFSDFSGFDGSIGAPFSMAGGVVTIAPRTDDMTPKQLWKNHTAVVDELKFDVRVDSVNTNAGGKLAAYSWSFEIDLGGIIPVQAASDDAARRPLVYWCNDPTAAPPVTATLPTAMAVGVWYEGRFYVEAGTRKFSLKNLSTNVTETVSLGAAGSPTMDALWLESPTTGSTSGVSYSSVEVTSGAGGATNQKQLVLANPLADPPPEYSNFIFLANTTTPKLFRVSSVNEVEKGRYQIEANTYDPAKWDYVEDGVAAAPPVFVDPRAGVVAPPTNLFINEKSLYVDNQVKRVVVVSWTASTSPVVASYTINYRIAGGNLTTVTNIKRTYFEIEGVLPGLLEVQVIAVSHKNVNSTQLRGTYTVTYVETTGSVLNPVTNLQVVGGGTNFTGRALTVEWTNPTSNGEVADSVADFKVEVLGGSTVVRTEYVPAVAPGAKQTYVYDYDKNLVDGGPRRVVTIKVQARDGKRRLSNATQATFNNAVPAALTGFSVVPGVGSIMVKWNRPTDSDFKGVLVWRDTNPGFAPTGANLVQDTTGTFITETNITPGTTYYYIAAPYDDFSREVNGLTLNKSYGSGAASGNAGIPSGPTLPSTGATGDLFFNTSNGKLFRRFGGQWTAAVPTVDLTGTVGNSLIENGAISTDKIINDAITTVKLADGAVVQDKIAARSINASKIVMTDLTNYVNNGQFTDADGAPSLTDWIKGGSDASTAVAYTFSSGPAPTPTPIPTYVALSANTAPSVNFYSTQKFATDNATDPMLISFWACRTAGAYIPGQFAIAVQGSGWVTPAPINVTTSWQYFTIQLEQVPGAFPGALSTFGIAIAGTPCTFYVTGIEVRKKNAAKLVVDGGITTNLLAANSVVASKIQAGAIETDKLAANSITSDKLTANSVIAGKIAASAVTADTIAANAITSDKLSANSVTAAKIQAGTITANEIADSTITNAKIGGPLYSTNFDGTFTGGVIATPGTQGWAIDQTGKMVLDATVHRQQKLNATQGRAYLYNGSGSATSTVSAAQKFSAITLATDQVVQTGASGFITVYVDTTSPKVMETYFNIQAVKGATTLGSPGFFTTNLLSGGQDWTATSPTTYVYNIPFTLNWLFSGNYYVSTATLRPGMSGTLPAPALVNNLLTAGTWDISVNTVLNLYDVNSSTAAVNIRYVTISVGGWVFEHRGSQPYAPTSPIL